VSIHFIHPLRGRRRKKLNRLRTFSAGDERKGINNSVIIENFVFLFTATNNNNIPNQLKWHSSCYIDWPHPPRLAETFSAPKRFEKKNRKKIWPLKKKKRLLKCGPLAASVPLVSSST
jgi:hypothetical protein